MFGYVSSDYTRSKFLVIDEKNISRKLYWVRPFLNRHFIKIPCTIESLNERHSRKSIYNINRSERKFYEHFDDSKFSILINREEIEPYLNEVRSLFMRRWSKRYVSLGWKKKAVFDKFSKEYLSLADKGNCRLFILTVNSRIIAFHYCIIIESTLYIFQHASDNEIEYRKFSIGRILTYNLFKHTILNDKHVEVIDFMFGDNEYKTFWTDEKSPVYSVYPKSIKGATHLLYDEVKGLIKFVLVTQKK